MNLCISLILSCDHLRITRRNQAKALQKQIANQAHRLRLAGGSIINIENISIDHQAESIDEQSKQLRLLQRQLMPSFVLCERRALLTEHFEAMQQNNDDIDLLDAWLDFSRLTYEAQSNQKGEAPTTSNTTEWQLKPRPARGWLVPIMTGFTAIAPLQGKGEVIGARSPDYQFSFVESVYSIGEWLSTHRMESIEDVIWQYKYDKDWYLCQQVTKPLNEDDSVRADEDNNDLYDFDYTA